MSGCTTRPLKNAANHTSRSEKQPLPESIVTRSAEETRDFGRQLAGRLRPPAVLALIGPLGAGKTCMVQGIARGLEVPDKIPVTSPTYTIHHRYKGRIPVSHIDLYRIQSPEEALELGFHDLLLLDGVTLIEWADRVEPLLPENTVRVTLEFLGEEKRRITVAIPSAKKS